LKKWKDREKRVNALEADRESNLTVLSQLFPPNDCGENSEPRSRIRHKASRMWARNG